MVQQSFALSFVCYIGLTGITTLTSLPSLSQAYPPMSLFQPSAFPNYPIRNICTSVNVIDCLESETKFKTLVGRIEATDFNETIEQHDKITLLAPSNDAFDALPDDVIDKLRQPENLKKVLQYHLILDEVTEEDINKGEITTLAGNAIAISHQSGTVTLNNANAIFPSTLANNGVIIEIDRVLIPHDF